MSSRIDQRPGFLTSPDTITVWVRGAIEVDDDLGLLHLVAELLDDALLDLIQVEARHLHDPDDGYLDRAVLGHALDAEIGGHPCDGREDVAAVAFEDAHLQRVAGRDGDAHGRRQIAGNRVGRSGLSGWR